MKSQTSLAARNCRLQEWSQMVHSCNNRPIGMSVDEWCREHSITTANYYYRMTQVGVRTCLQQCHLARCSRKCSICNCFFQKYPKSYL